MVLFMLVIVVFVLLIHVMNICLIQLNQLDLECLTYLVYYYQLLFGLLLSINTSVSYFVTNLKMKLLVTTLKLKNTFFY